LLEGKNVNLRVMEKEDLPLFAEWVNMPEVFGEYVWLPQESRAELAKRYDNFAPDTRWFL
jgi:RimJ/RimL family protein N-acetyltransferase